MESLQSWELLGKVYIKFRIIKEMLAGNIMIYWRWFVVACRRREAFCKGLNCTPTRRGLGLWSPNGVAKILQGAKPVRLAAEAAFLG